MSHFLTKEKAREQDNKTIELLKSLEINTLLRKVGRGENIMCGGGPVLALLLYARKLGEAKVAVLSTGDSTAAGGPADQVVGYMSAAVYLEEKSQALNFSQEEKRIVDPGQKIYRTLSEKWRVFNLRNFEFKISGEKGCLCYPERKRGASRLYWFCRTGLSSVPGCYSMCCLRSCPGPQIPAGEAL